jgi:hypothetical protein
MRRCFNWGEDEERGGKEVRIKRANGSMRGEDAGGVAWWLLSGRFPWCSTGRRFLLWPSPGRFSGVSAFWLQRGCALKRQLPCTSS